MRRTLLVTIVSVLSFCSSRSTLLGGEIVVGDGQNRPATVHVPASYDPAVPMPLVFLLHGFTGTGDGVEGNWRFQPLADERGFLYVHPQGTRDHQGRTFWDATDACCNFSPAAVDDSGYLRGLIDEIDAELNVDRDRIFFAGHSNGGFMSHRMACDHPDTVAAIASLAGVVFADAGRCDPESPVHVLQIHGTSDATIFFNGGTIVGVPYPGAQRTIEMWAEDNGCALEELETRDSTLDIAGEVFGAETTQRYYTNCQTGGSAELWTIANGSHGPSFVRNGCSTNLAAHVIDWLLAHPKRPTPEVSFTVTPESGVGPLEVVVEATEVATPEGTNIATYRWDFGDGTRAEGVTASHTYETPGRHRVSLVVITDDGRVSARQTKRVSVLCPAGQLSPWIAADVGEPFLPGAAREEGTDELLICSGGSSIGGREDDFFFVHQELSGSFRITAEVAVLSAQTYGRAGVMVRAGLAADAPFAAMLLETLPTANRLRLRYRQEPGAHSRTRSQRGDAETVAWVRVERRGNIFSGLTSPDGEGWTLVRDVEIDAMPETLLVGVGAAVAGGCGDPVEPLQVRTRSLEASALDETPLFLRGHCNDDGNLDISDAVCILDWLFVSGKEPGCVAATNVNGDKTADLTDAVYLLGFLFLGDAAPVEPFAACGPSALASDQELGCETPPKDCVSER